MTALSAGQAKFKDGNFFKTPELAQLDGIRMVWLSNSTKENLGYIGNRGVVLDTGYNRALRGFQTNDKYMEGAVAPLPEEKRPAAMLAGYTEMQTAIHAKAAEIKGKPDEKALTNKGRTTHSMHAHADACVAWIDHKVQKQQGIVDSLAQPTGLQAGAQAKQADGRVTGLDNGQQPQVQR